MKFKDLFELATWATCYEKILNENYERKNSSIIIYCQDPNIEINLVDDHVQKRLDITLTEVMVIKSYTCKVLERLQRTSKVS